MKYKFLKYFPLLIILSTAINVAQATNPASTVLVFLNRALNTTHPPRNPAQSPDTNLQIFVLAGILSFAAAAISSAGGIGGGGLFIPILTIVVGFDLRLASSYSAFMVTGGSIANVACQFFFGSGKPLIDYDIALLSEPCMLLGVSCGVIFNLVLPEWLITVFFAVFLAFCTFRTCRSGVCFWKIESEGMRRRNGGGGRWRRTEKETCGESTELPLLSGEVGEGKVGMKVGMLVVIWFSFFVLYLLRGNRYGQGIIHVDPCGTVYWIISSIQIPLAIIFTTWMLHGRKCPNNTQQENGDETVKSQSLVFPIMALLAGVLGGVFGIGGGMLISPLLLQIGIEPEVTAATCSFMVLFSSTMSAIQYVLLGMEHIYGALIFAAICFVASLVGLTLVQRAIMKHGRASLIVFSVGTVMALSTVLITGFGAVDVWRDYTSGKSMGFKKPC